MITSEITPNSLPSIRKLAKQISKTSEMSYSTALDVASRRAGHQDYRTAKLWFDSHSIETFTATIVRPWWDYSDRSYGEVRLNISLSMPLNKLIKPHQTVGRLSGYRVKKSELIGRELKCEEKVARWWVTKTARALQFVDATGFKPCQKGYAVWPHQDWDNRIPGCDHSEEWFDPVNRKYLITDEPYRPAVADRQSQRSQWCSQYDYECIRARWAGMHNPDGENGTELYLIAKSADKIPLRSIEQKLKNAPFQSVT